jgi:hypothetical protein
VNEPRRDEEHEGRKKKKISNISLGREYNGRGILVKLKHYIDLCTSKESKYLIFGL